MKKIIILITINLLLAFSINAQSWTYLVYMVGSDLESGGQAGTNDLIEMIEVGSSANLNVIVTTGGANKNDVDNTGINWKEIQRWRVIKDDLEAISYSAGDNDMANESNLTDFITWGVNTYPADNYALVLWDHGMALDGFGHDENSGNHLSVNQLKSALNNAYLTTNTKFEVLGFDACLMANLEVAYNLKDYANYYVASEETEPGHGWNYTPILEHLTTTPTTDGAALGQVTADGFLAQAKSPEWNTSGITLSVTDLSKIDNVVVELENFVGALTPTVKKRGINEINYTPVAKGRAKVEEYGKSAQSPEYSSDVVDLSNWVELVKNVETSLSTDADRLINAIDDAVIYTVRDNTKPKSKGLTVYIPYNQLKDENVLNQNIQSYQNIEFSAIYQDFISEYITMSQSDDNDPELQDDIVTENNTMTATCISDDLDEAFVVLMNSTYADENEIILMGVMLPDEINATDNGYELSYEWDGLWFSINEQVAYISDIYEERYVDEEMNELAYFVVEIPAMLNNNDIVMTFYTDGEDFELVNIIPDTGEGEIPSKERIRIKEGDKLTLIYEGINLTTDEEIWYEGETITINSADDIQLTVEDLPDGDYMLGYYLSDYNQNETFIFDETVYNVNNITSITAQNNNANINVYPQPASDYLNFKLSDNTNYNIELIDMSGKVIRTFEVNSSFNQIDVSSMQNGYYIAKFISEKEVFTQKVVIQK